MWMLTKLFFFEDMSSIDEILMLFILCSLVAINSMPAACMRQLYYAMIGPPL